MEELLQRHKKELRKLQGEMTRLKKSAPKGDKKKKKEVAAQIEQMEKDMKMKHLQEIKDLECSGDSNGNDKEADTSDVAPVTASDNVQEQETQTQPQTQPKKSRAQKRREKKEQEAREREKRIKDGTPKEGESEQEIEHAVIMEQLSPLSLTISKIAPDGNCLFESVRVQLPDADSVSVRSVREAAARHMLDHMDDFLPFLTTEEGDVMSPEAFSAYCERMSTSNDWGGLAEIRALANVYKAVVKVFQAFTPVQEIKGTGADEETAVCINLSFHKKQFGLGAHYNAVVQSK
eukprot:m.44718 g.44718  ORF g.44718 m.44718 type:complete len:291 (+) comp10620_c0_seq2:61-933(+)